LDNRIREFYKRYGLSVVVNRISEGPSVVTYGITTRGKVKASQVTNLLDDLSLVLSRRVRMFVNPEGGYIAVEVPKDDRNMVLFDDINIPTDKPLEVPIGINMQGNIFTSDITTMPHVLIAGTTGSGKSILVHSIISYLISHNTRDKLQLVLIDPKRVELTAYQDIPHLAIEIQTDIESSIQVLDGVVSLMESRYKTLEDARCKNISEYAGSMPYILVVIDELADLMMTSKGQVESSIVRLAQMARAVGIHLILATQRPSTDVVTGLIKANFPTRIALSVASNMDSRVILDASGAERLIGKGDMLYMSPSHRLPIRMQGAYISSQKMMEICKSAMSTENDRIERMKEMTKNLIKVYTKEKWVVEVEYLLNVDVPDDEEGIREILITRNHWNFRKVQSEILELKGKEEL
jgi:DNA segregation ATPase FtsK/SpoIIIE, S-DNA-T family